MRKVKVCLLMFFILFLWGCSDLYYYDLYIEPRQEQDPLKIPGVLLVEDIETNQAFWYRRMAYRRSPYRLKYFTFKQWAKSPGELIKDTIVRFYKNSSLFEKVVEPFFTVEPDIKMKVHIDAIEMCYREKRWFARLALDIEIIDAKNEKVILAHFFDRMKRIKGKKARYVPEKISAILQEELLKIVKKLKEIY